MSFPPLDDRERQRQRELWGYSPSDHRVQQERSGKLTPDGEGGNDVRAVMEIEGWEDKQPEGRGGTLAVHVHSE